ALGTVFGGKYSCQGCLWCLRKFLDKDVYAALIKAKPDIIISCGSSVAPVNFVLSRQNLAKSMVIMRPSFLSTKRFDLVVMSRHDQASKRKNIVVIDGALNLINDEYLKSQGQSLAQKVNISKEFVLGLLIGGDTKDFKLSEGSIRKLIAQAKESLEKFDGEILITTSRRTPANIERLLKEGFKDHPRCKLLIIANEKNIPEAVGGILALSRVIITSPESISMICEAVNSRKHVLVFKSPGLSRKHERFLAHFAENKYIYLAEADNLSQTINDAWLTKPQVHTLKDNDLVKEAIGRLL
ncbi:MAG: ELM1/GtrOC1 family putative glycosyltransferase, partial [Candidatus Omnitrophica bacterium]|nr:ELM1/GtrOC1 family putative glycosyltransferase [Candidatus Omnitrophota bacterium]